MREHADAFAANASRTIATDLERLYAAWNEPRQRAMWLPEALKSGDRKKIIPPLHGALLKNEQDVHLFERLVFMTRRAGS